VDLEQISERFGDREVMRELLACFLVTVPPLLAQILDGLGGGEGEGLGQARAAAHAMVGAAYTAAAVPLAELCRGLERDLIDGRADDARGRTAAVVAEFERVRQAIAPLILPSPTALAEDRP